MSILELVDVRLELKGKPILNGVSFTVAAGEMVGVLGASGSGKTTLFRILNLLQTPSQGSVLYQGRNTLEYPPAVLRRQIGYVFQKTYLFGDTIQDNLIYPYQLLGQKPDFHEITAYLAKANLSENVLLKKTHELSGGEQQRVALIRSLLIKPRILLLDEVTASLDEENTLIIEKLIVDQNADNQVTVLFISHNIAQAARLASRILLLANGRVSFFGSKNDYFVQKEQQHE